MRVLRGASLRPPPACPQRGLPVRGGCRCFSRRPSSPGWREAPTSGAEGAPWHGHSCGRVPGGQSPTPAGGGVTDSQQCPAGGGREGGAACTGTREHPQVGGVLSPQNQCAWQVPPWDTQQAAALNWFRLLAPELRVVCWGWQASRPPPGFRGPRPASQLRSRRANLPFSGQADC